MRDEFQPQKGAKMSQKKDLVFVLGDRVREVSFGLHCFLRHGHKEKIYENGVVNRLVKHGIGVRQQPSISVFDEDGTLLGKLDLDLLIGGKLIVEINSVKTLLNEHIVQLPGFMRATRIEHGLPIDFGAPVLQIKKYSLSQDLDSAP